VGSLINFWFAYKEFKEGNYAKGILELVGGILNFVPGLGPVLSLGVDLLKVFLDQSGAFDEGGSLSNENLWSTVKGWAASIGNWIWENALWMPILGGVKRMMMAKESFDKGDYTGALYQLGMGLLSFTGAAPLVTGIELLLGYLNNKEDQSGDLSPDNSWSGRLKKWIKEKLKQLPYVIRKPLEWFGIVDESGDSKISWDGVEDGARKGFESTKNFMTSVWDKIKGPMDEGIGKVGEFAKDAWTKTKDFASQAWDTVSTETPKLWESIKEGSSKAWDTMGNIVSMYTDGIKQLSERAQEKISEWSPKVMEVISGVMDHAIKTLENIASKIGSWLSGFFMDDVKRSENEKSKQDIFRNKEMEGQIASLEASDAHGKLLNMLYASSNEQVRLLAMLVNVGNSSYQELKRISGNRSGGGTSMIVPVPQTQKQSQLVTLSDNRSDYMGSPYALT